jgi:tetratricopeptide (TPR) repeat protein
MEQYFVSYSTRDASRFVTRLRRALETGPTPVKVWRDKDRLRAGASWERGLNRAIDESDALLFVMTADSVREGCVCANELERARQYKKTIIPLRVEPIDPVDVPLLINTLQIVDFTSGFEAGLADLRRELRRRESTDGRLDELDRHLASARRDLESSRSPSQRKRIELEIEQLQREDDELRRIMDPARADEELDKSINDALLLEQQVRSGEDAQRHVRVVNGPPQVVSDTFQDRQEETRLLEDLLRAETARLVVILGSGSMGKTAMVCRLLDAMQEGRQLHGSPIDLDGVVYLDTGAPQPVTGRMLLGSLAKLLQDDDAARLDEFFSELDVGLSVKVRELLEALDGMRIVVLIDAAEALLEPRTADLRDPELKAVLEELVALPQHRITVMLTTRQQPSPLTAMRGPVIEKLDLDAGLLSPHAENLLRELDKDGAAGLRDAPPKLLAQARRQTKGNPLALKAIYAILRADRFTSLPGLLQQTAGLPPEEAVEVFLMGEVFSRLDRDAKRVVQALAVYRSPVQPGAVDHMLRPYLGGRRSKQILDRLAWLRLVTRDGRHFRLPSAYWEHVLSRVPRDEPDADDQGQGPPFSQVILARRGADYFSRARKMEEEYQDRADLTAQLIEFDLRVRGGQRDMAAKVLLDIDQYLLAWGYNSEVLDLHQRLQGRLHPDLEQGSLGIIGTAYYQLGEFEQAKRYYHRALRVVRSLEDDELRLPFLINLGGVHYELGETDQALGYYKQSLELARAVGGREEEEAAALNGVGLCQTDIGGFELALDHYREALEIAHRQHDSQLAGQLLANLGFVHGMRGDADAAMDSFGSALIVARGSGDRLLHARSLTGRAEIMLDRGHPQEAAKRAKEALEANREVENRSLARDGNCLLALARLRTRAIKAARAAVEAACMHSSHRWAHPAFAVKGIVALREDDPEDALGAFDVAMGEAEALLEGADESFVALDAMGLALAGRVLCGERRRLPEAADAYRAARIITSHDGVVTRTLGLFDDLARADRQEVLAKIRPIAAGQR